MAPSQAGSDKPQPVYKAMHLLLERIVAAPGLEWSVLEDNKLLIPICPQFAVALRESWTRVQTASLSKLVQANSQVMASVVLSSLGELVK